jgi:hypothetical protein
MDRDDAGRLPEILMKSSMHAMAGGLGLAWCLAGAACDGTTQPGSAELGDGGGTAQAVGIAEDAGDAGDASAPMASSQDASAWDGPLPACSWPASLDVTDASDGRCVAARALLACTSPNGVGEGCISNDPTQCPGGGAGLVEPAGSTFTCQDQCPPDRYAIRCGTVGPGSPGAPEPPPPPDGCNNMEYTPAGIWFACCPCGT